MYVCMYLLKYVCILCMYFALTQMSPPYIKHNYVDLPWKALLKQVLAKMYFIMETEFSKKWQIDIISGKKNIKRQIPNLWSIPSHN